MPVRFSATAFSAALIFGFLQFSRADAPPPAAESTSTDASSPNAEPDTDQAAPAPAEAPKPAGKKPTGSSRRQERANGFVAPPSWEFDGYVSGGQDQEVRSMFYLNDLVYLNVGSDHGLGTGDRVSIYKRGEKVHDPRTGRSMGYEIRLAAIGQVTDRISGKTCAVRILQDNEAVEVGDLVRRDE